MYIPTRRDQGLHINYQIRPGLICNFTLTQTAYSIQRCSCMSQLTCNLHKYSIRYVVFVLLICCLWISIVVELTSPFPTSEQPLAITYYTTSLVGSSTAPPTACGMDMLHSFFTIIKTNIKAQKTFFPIPTTLNPFNSISTWSLTVLRSDSKEYYQYCANKPISNRTPLCLTHS